MNIKIFLLKCNIIIYILSIFSFINVAFSNNIISDINNKTMFFIAKKEFKKRKYIISDYLFNNLFQSNHISEKYAQKAKIYSVIVKLKYSNFKNAKNLNKSLLINNKIISEKYLNYIYYINSYIAYRFNRNLINIFINYKSDQTLSKKALKNISRIKNLKKYNDILLKSRKKIESSIKKNEIYIANYYFDNKAYLSVIKRIKFNSECVDVYDYYKNYLLVRSYNELYLSDVSKDIIKILK